MSETHNGCGKYVMVEGRRRLLSGTQQYCKDCPLKGDIEACEETLRSLGLELLYPKRKAIKRHYENEGQQTLDNMHFTGFRDDDGGNQGGVALAEPLETIIKREAVEA